MPTVAPLSKPASIASRYELKYLIQPELAQKIIDFLIPQVEIDARTQTIPKRAPRARQTFLELAPVCVYWATDSTVSRGGTNNRRSRPVSAPNLSGNSSGRW